MVRTRPRFTCICSSHRCITGASTSARRLGANMSMTGFDLPRSSSLQKSACSWCPVVVLPLGPARTLVVVTTSSVQQMMKFFIAMLSFVSCESGSVLTSERKRCSLQEISGLLLNGKPKGAAFFPASLNAPKTHIYLPSSTTFEWTPQSNAAPSAPFNRRRSSPKQVPCGQHHSQERRMPQIDRRTALTSALAA